MLESLLLIACIAVIIKCALKWAKNDIGINDQNIDYKRVLRSKINDISAAGFCSTIIILFIFTISIF